MKPYLALLRGINVGGHSSLSMKDLAATLERLGLRGVQTYIQSGNAVFLSRAADPAKLSRKIQAALREEYRLAPHVFLLELAEMERILAANPFAEAASEPRSLHLYFLDAAPSTANLKALESLRTPREQIVLKGNVLYLHAPDGIGRSKLAASVEKCLGVAATARNWRTAGKIVEMAQQQSQ